MPSDWCRRLVAGELTLSFVPDAEQRLWRTVTRRKYQLTCNRVQFQNRLEALLEEMHVKLSSLVSDLLGPSARRMLRCDRRRRDRSGRGGGPRPPAAARHAGGPSRCARARAPTCIPCIGGSYNWRSTELRGIEAQIEALNQEIGGLFRRHQDAVQRLAAVPGLGVDSAQQIIAEVGPDAVTFPAPKQMASWVGVCPGARGECGGELQPPLAQGNRQMRRLLNQAANAAVKTKGSIFELVYRRLGPRLGHQQAIGAIAHRLCRLIWKILHDGMTYEERGPAVTKERLRARSAKMIRELRAWVTE